MSSQWTTSLIYEVIVAKKGQKKAKKRPKKAKKVTEKKAKKKNMTMKENTNPIAHEFITF